MQLEVMMSKVQSWEVSDEFWKRVEPLIPSPPRKPIEAYQRRPGAGRPRKDARLVFEAIVYVLRTGCHWKALPAEFGSGSAIHAYFLKWEAAGFFEKLWQAGLAEYDDLQGIAWRWQSIDGSTMKAPLTKEAVGKNPTDRGKKRQQTTPAGGFAWRPVVPHRDRSEPARHYAA
jgi:transposase